MRNVMQAIQARAAKRGRAPRLLIIRPAGIGDVVMSLPIIPNLRAAFPDAQIDFLTDPPSVPLLQAVPALTNVLRMDKHDMRGMIGRIRRTGYDAVFDLYQNPRTMWLTLFSGARWRISFDQGSRRWAYNVRTPYPAGKYHVGKTLDMLRACSIPIVTETAEYPVSEPGLAEARVWLHNWLPGNQGVLGLLPTGGWPSKRCDPDKLASLAAALCQQFGWQVLLLGGKADADVMAETGRHLTALGVTWREAPAVSIVQLGAVLRACQLVLGNDSGPGHIAATTGVPTLILFGPSLPQMVEYNRSTVRCLQLTRDQLDCIQCELSACPRQHECFYWIQDQWVIAEAEAALAADH